MTQPQGTPSSPSLAAYAARQDLVRYGSNSLLLFALQIGFGIEDIDSVATTALTDGSNDKKCDLVYVDHDGGRAIVAQGYSSANERPAAPANKASDLNTAVAWLLGTDNDDVPDRLKPARSELHEAIRSGQVSRLELWYVHNLNENVNFQEELNVACTTARALLDSVFNQHAVEDVVAREIGRNTLDHLYETSQVPILVGDDFVVPARPGFSEQGERWDAYCTSVPASWLAEVFNRYGTDLFSANVRDYLGSVNKDANINNNIKQTAKDQPEHFFAYNNGLTVLVNDFIIPSSPVEPLRVSGLSIVNGAQTTGAVSSSSASRESLEQARVMVRFMKCSDQRVVREIIQYNNSQNKIEAADFRSNDKIQDKLRAEFGSIPEAEYRGGRRGSETDIIERRPNLIPTQTAAQAIAAFHQMPSIAYNETKKIWSSDETYSQVFPEFITAKHVLFCYSLLKAIEEAKFALTQIPDDQRTSAQNTQVGYFRQRGSIIMLATAISSCIETILNHKITDTWKLRFSRNLNPDEAVAAWQSVLIPMLSFVNQLEEALGGYLKNPERNNAALTRFQGLVDATREALGGTAFTAFGSAVTDK